MPPEAIEALGAWLGITTLGAFVLMGMRLRLKAKSSESPKLEKLTEAVEGLYDQNQALREDVAELQERLDFHERLLTRGRETVSTPV